MALLCPPGPLQAPLPAGRGRTPLDSREDGPPRPCAIGSRRNGPRPRRRSRTTAPPDAATTDSAAPASANGGAVTAEATPLAGATFRAEPRPSSTAVATTACGGAGPTTAPALARGRRVAGS